MASAFLSKFQITHQDLFSIYASLNGILMLIRTVLEAIPNGIRQYINKVFHGFFKMNRPDRMTLVVEQNIEFFGNNKIYEAAEAYLRTIINPDINRLKISKTERQKNFISSIEEGQEIVDTYNGIEINWKYVRVEPEKGSVSIPPEYLPSRFNNSTKHYFYEIEFPKKLKDMIYKSYLPYIMTRYDQMKKEEKEVRLHTLSINGGKHKHLEGWRSVKFEHPVTFDKLAMEPKQKKMITDDLDRFVKRKEFYQRIGKVWKRGYLLYGPPGTGKTSLIAAMANYLNFDIYDLALSTISSDSDLREILLSTTNQSILIIEDMDCNAEVQNRSQAVDKSSPDPKLTLSGLLNFFDGLWSSCGDERIIVVTTNHKEAIDPALLRPGRMDFHIHMSYCTPAGFKILAQNYLGLIDDNPLSDEIQKLLINAKVTPAKVSEELMISEEPEIALNAVLTLLKQNITEQQAEESAQMHQVSMIDHQESEY